VKAEQIDIQNMQSEMSNLSEKIKDLPEVKFLKKSLKNLEETLNKKNEQCKNSLETQFDGQLSKFSSSLEGKFETDAKKLQEDLEKKLSQSQDKMDVKLESHRVQLQSLSSLEAKLDSKYAKIEEAIEKLNEQLEILAKDDADPKAREIFHEASRTLEMANPNDLKALGETMFQDMHECPEKQKEVDRLAEVTEKLNKFVGVAADNRKKYNITGV